MSNNNKNIKQTPQNSNEENILISTNDIEQFKTMLDNFGNELSIINGNYKKLLNCK